MMEAGRIDTQRTLDRHSKFRLACDRRFTAANQPDWLPVLLSIELAYVSIQNWPFSTVGLVCQRGAGERAGHTGTDNDRLSAARC